jgi:hypothetical protein
LEKEEDYCSYTPIRVQILTFNIDSRKPADLDATLNDKNIFDSLFDRDVDIYVFGFQELVDLENVGLVN